MSGQLSGWRERVHANPSRMEQELAIRTTRPPDKISYTGRNTSIEQFCVARLAHIPEFSRFLIASRILSLTWTAGLFSRCLLGTFRIIRICAIMSPDIFPPQGMVTVG